MPVKSSYLDRELKQAYIQRRVSNASLLRLGLFFALLAFALYFVLQSVAQSVVADVAPILFQPSYFTVLFLYNWVAYIGLVLYYLRNIEVLTFAEVVHNRWYVLLQMGFRPLAMIASKYAARLFSVFVIYSVGFLVAFFLTTFLKYPLVVGYLPSLYVAGLLDLIFVVTGTMAASLFLRTKGAARWVIAAVAVGFVALKFFSGFEAVVSDRAAMGSLLVLFQPSRSGFLPALAGAALLCVGATVFFAQRRARRYQFDYYRGDMDVPAGTQIVVPRHKSMQPVRGPGFPAPSHQRVVDVLVTAVLAVVIGALLAFNLLVLALTVTTPGKQVAVLGVMPLIFQSDTMQPTLETNDLAFFRPLSADDAVNIDDILFYKKGEEISIARVKAIQGTRLTMNVDYYAPSVKADYLKEDIDRSTVTARYAGRSRWLGALLLFSNSVFGRLLFLLVPCVLIFYYNAIRRTAMRLTTNGGITSA